MPADGSTPVFATRDIHRAIDQHRENQSRTGAEFQAAHAALDSVFEGVQLHAGKLRQHAGARREVAPGKSLFVELHRVSVSVWSWALAASGPSACPESMTAYRGRKTRTGIDAI